MLGGDPDQEESALRYKVRNLALIGLSVALLAACGKPATPSSGAPDFVEPSATPALAAGDAATPATSSPSAGPSSKSASPTPSPSKAVKVTYAFPVIGNNGYARTHHD